MSRRHKELNVAETLEKYKDRIETLPVQEFEELNGCYLSTFDVFSTVADVSSSIKSHAIVLMQVARGKNIDIKGVTSERKSRGEYICFELLDGDTRATAQCTYVGKYNYFTSHEQSKWAIRPADRVFVIPSPRS